LAPEQAGKTLVTGGELLDLDLEKPVTFYCWPDMRPTSAVSKKTHMAARTREFRRVDEPAPAP
jgi:hypothetical protein